MFTQLRVKINRNEWVIQTRKAKTGSSNFSSRLRRRLRPSCVRSLTLPSWRTESEQIYLLQAVELSKLHKICLTPALASESRSIARQIVRERESRIWMISSRARRLQSKDATRFKIFNCSSAFILTPNSCIIHAKCLVSTSANFNGYDDVSSVSDIERKGSANRPK